MKGFGYKLRLFARGLRFVNSFGKSVMLVRTLVLLFSSAVPFINIWFGAAIINELAGTRDSNRLILLVALITGLNFAAGIILAGLRRLLNYCGSQIWTNIRYAYSDKMLSLDYADAESPDVQKKYSDVEQHHRGMGFGIGRLMGIYDGLLGGVIRVGLSVAFAFSLFTLPIPADGPLQFLDSPLFVAAVLLALGLSVFLSPYIAMVGGRVWAETAEVNNAQNRVLVYYFYGLPYAAYLGKDIRIYDQKRLADVHAQEVYNLKRWLGYAHYAAKFDTASNVLTHVCNMAIYLFVAMKAYAGAFGVGSIVQYVGAISQFGSGCAAVVHNLGELNNNHTFLEAAFQYLDLPSRKASGTDSPASEAEHAIEFRNVSFKYPGTEAYALKNLNLTINPKQRLAVVGENGSGKTTMIKLLCRLYEPDEGAIFMGGKNIKDFDHKEYMDLFGVVFQDFALFPFSIGQNVACGTKYDDAAVRDALDKVGFTERLADMSGGLDTYLYKNFEKTGVEISGGEAQKIAMARALYKKTPFVILDEPTAALDPKAEFEIYSKFDTIVGGKTAVYISHRLASCRFCDRIAVFHEGAVIQEGSHEKLLATKGGKYHELFTAQAQYYA